MPVFAIPLIIQGAEAIFLGIGAGVAAHAAGQDFWTSAQIGIAAMFGKLLPKQLLGKNQSEAQAKMFN